MSQVTGKYGDMKTESYKIFDRIASRYDLLNRILSLGLDVRWRKTFAEKAATGAETILDLATGTADVPIAVCRSEKGLLQVVGLDLSERMLAIGQEKVRRLGLGNRISLRKGDAASIPFPDSWFDAVTIAFGIRNTPDPACVLSEMLRVLRPGGKALVMEFSLPPNPFLRLCHLAYLKTLVPVIGFLFSGNYRAYRYLNKTIEEFPYGQEFMEWMARAGFTTIRQLPLTFGAASIYIGVKPS